MGYSDIDAAELFINILDRCEKKRFNFPECFWNTDFYDQPATICGNVYIFFPDY